MILIVKVVVIMELLDFFDCNCRVGMRTILNPGSFYSTGDLVKRMESHGIGKALVNHSMAREYNPAVGNGMLAEEIKSHPCLYPAWVVMHHHTGEFPEPDVLKIQLRDNNIKAVLMFPDDSEQKYSTSEWNCGELFSMLEACRVPLLIGMNQMNWDELYGLCSSHPELRIVLTDLDYRADRNLYSLLNRFEYLYLETIGYKVHNGIEEICSRFGAKRLVFGSGMPIYSGGSAVSMINYARISEKEKRMIAGENLERLLEGVKL
jgi:predicted TIM-barrel fold metal-dependent hydrolase